MSPLKNGDLYLLEELENITKYDLLHLEYLEFDWIQMHAVIMNWPREIRYATTNIECLKIRTLSLYFHKMPLLAALASKSD